MAKKSFEEQYPQYAIIPSKKSKWTGLLMLSGTVLVLGAIVYGLFKELSQLNAPVANMAGINKNTVSTLKNLAITQSNSGQYEAAAKNFKSYFELGGDEANAMAAYAISLDALGLNQEAVQWSNKAVAKDPNSRTARFVQSQLKEKSK
ncbi:MAG: hypothetical protein ACXVA9_10845 [Bdellovibrionales bacterium]